MRHQPLVIDRIARVTAAKMIVDAALAHARQRKLGGVKKPIVFGACAGAPQEFKHRAFRFCAILLGSSRKMRATSRNTSVNATRPYCDVFGKYVPPQNGEPSGARNIVSGQPPCPPNRCNAFM